jgi:hypothetical protein
MEVCGAEHRQEEWGGTFTPGVARGYQYYALTALGKSPENLTTRQLDNRTTG